jgi:hypothetical protein
MRKKTRIVCLGVFLTAPLWAQEGARSVAYQQPGWIAAPGSTEINVHITRPDGQSGPVLSKPFSATEVRTTKQSLNDGNTIDHTDNSRFYRDAEGRMREESGHPASSRVGHVLIFDPVGGATFEINPQTKTYVKWSAGPGKKSITTIASTQNGTWVESGEGAGLPVQTVPQAHVPYRTDPVMAYQTVDLGKRMLNGVLCKGTRTIMTIPVSAVGNAHEIKIVDERWYSDELGALVKSSDSDPRFGVSSYELTDVVQADPDESLFRVPPDYIEKPRSF